MFVCRGKQLVVRAPYGPDYGIIVEAGTERFVAGWSTDPRDGAHVRSFRTHAEARGRTLREALERLLDEEEGRTTQT